MSNEALADIQRALNLIRAQLDNEDAQTQLDALRLITMTAQEVIANTKTLAEPRTITKTKIVPVIKKDTKPNRAKAQIQPDKQPKQPPKLKPIQTIKPKKPLPPKRPVSQ